MYDVFFFVDLVIGVFDFWVFVEEVLLIVFVGLLDVVWRLYVGFDCWSFVVFV